MPSSGGLRCGLLNPWLQPRSPLCIFGSHLNPLVRGPGSLRGKADLDLVCCGTRRCFYIARDDSCRHGSRFKIEDQPLLLSLSTSSQILTPAPKKKKILDKDKQRRSIIPENQFHSAGRILAVVVLMAGLAPVTFGSPVDYLFIRRIHPLPSAMEVYLLSSTFVANGITE